MTVFDTSVVIDHVRKNEALVGNVTIVTVVEYPPILEYSRFTGSVIYPTRDAYNHAITIQQRLRGKGKPKTFSDILIAAICIKGNELLKAYDSDFDEIAEVSSLKLEE